MGNKTIFTFAFFLSTLVLQAQINISFDGDCLRKNTATLSQALIDLKGEEFVSSLLENNINFSIFCAVDSSGVIIEFKKIRSNKGLPWGIEKELLSYLDIKGISFFICYEKPSGATKERAYYLMRKGLFEKNHTSYLININFPGDLMSLYSYEKEKARERGLFLSRYNYLISMINTYTLQPCEN